MFTLSAVPPELMYNVLRQAACSIKPKGFLLFRDYGLCDMTQLRYKPAQRRGVRLYQRLDGTLAYFFRVEDVKKLMHSAGFTCVECDYVCVLWKNRKKKQNMKRVFVHGVFQRM